MHLHGVGKLHQGTIARIYEDSLSGIAAKYVELEPGPNSAPEINSGGTIGQGNTYSEVNLDELFNTLNAKTRSGLSNLIQGEAASLKGSGRAANRTLEYLAPGLASASQVTQELSRDEPSFDGLLVQGAKAMQALASKSDELTQLVSNTSQTAAAIDRQSPRCSSRWTCCPGVLRRSTTTFAGLDTTLDALTPVVNASKPNLAQLAQFASALNTISKQALPTVGAAQRPDLQPGRQRRSDLAAAVDAVAGEHRGRRLPEADQAVRAVQAAAELPARVHAGRRRRALQRRTGERQLRRQRALRPDPARLVRVHDQRRQRARRADSLRPLCRSDST